MTPDEARKDCEICGGRSWLCQYHEGYEDGYEAAQRERGPIQAVGKPLPRHFASEEPQGRPGR